jgi:predicted SnoaL-like aldol condensation-catalyzing enzyme
MRVLCITLVALATGCSRQAPENAAAQWTNPYPRAEMPGRLSDTPQERANLEVAVRYFDAVNNAADAEVASRLSTQTIALHDPEREDGHTALAALIAAQREANPQSRSEIKRIVTEGDHVFVHAHTVLAPGSLGFISGNLYRIADGRVAEQRTILHAIPEKPHKDNPNNAFCADGKSDCPSTVDVPREQEALNKQRAIEFYDAALNEKNWPKTLDYIGDRFTQHSLYAQDGPGSLEDLTKRLIQEHPDNRGDLKIAIADGDLVVKHLHVTRYRGHPGWSVFEIARLENGRVVEHWDMFRTVPETGGERLF